MSERRFAILDPAAGISGDMLLGALLDAGAPEEWLKGLPARLGLEGVTVEVSRVDRCGVGATKVTVRLPDGSHEPPAPEVGAHDHGHSGDGHHGPHRHVGELVGLVEKAPLSAVVREKAVRAFKLLAEAEGRVHGVAPDRVALHEVGALDALVDIVGGLEGFERLGVERVFSRPVALGRGWVRAAHGALPVPAPATGLLLEGLETVSDGPVTGEATTPTGAVLLRVLEATSPPSRWRWVRTGWGAGGRNPAGYPNALRLVVAEPAAEAGEAVVVATDLDDLAPEYLDPLRQALAAAGAVDVQVWGTHGKKGRPGFRIEAVTPPADEAAVVAAFFRHSTTAGVRRWRTERVTLPRREIEVELAEGLPVRVKVLEGPDGPRIKPEYEDVAAAARRLDRPAHEVAQEVTERAQRGIGTGPAASD